MSVLRGKPILEIRIRNETHIEIDHFSYLNDRVYMQHNVV